MLGLNDILVRGRSPVRAATPLQTIPETAGERTETPRRGLARSQASGVSPGFQEQPTKRVPMLCVPPLQGLACISERGQQLSTGKHRLSGVRHSVGDIGEVMPMETFAGPFGQCSLGPLFRLANNALQNGDRAVGRCSMPPRASSTIAAKNKGVSVMLASVGHAFKRVKELGWIAEARPLNYLQLLLRRQREDSNKAWVRQRRRQSGIPCRNNERGRRIVEREILQLPSCLACAKTFRNFVPAVKQECDPASRSGVC